jgi:hypothetical protein
MKIPNLLWITLLCAVALSVNTAARPLSKLKVSENRRFIVKADKTPFFYLADTAWELFHRTSREEAINYLNKRAGQKFTVIQAVALAELDGITDPNVYGDLPLINRDPTRPAVTPGANPNNKMQYDYWDHVDFIVREANRRGLYIALLPSWGRWILNRPPRDINILTTANAQQFGEFLGKRYRNDSIIWILGGDRTAAGYQDVYRAMARGISIGVTGKEDYNKLLISYHPGGGHTSSEWFHNDEWLSFNMQQTGHGRPSKALGWDKISGDYNLTPTKPVIEGEPLYEDHPIGFVRGVRENGFSSDNHVRQRAYWHLFAGACGFAFGNHAVWQMYAPGRIPINGPLYYWYEAIHRPAAAQMQYVRALIESRPQLSRIPDQSLVIDTLSDYERIQATRGDGYAFIYTGAGIRFNVRMGKISGSQAKAYWYNPRNGSSNTIGIFENTGTREFVPPYEGLGSDWVLVLDDLSKNFRPPGK